jgi:thioredoxin-like negative regulator of GroEL
MSQLVQLNVITLVLCFCMNVHAQGAAVVTKPATAVSVDEATANKIKAEKKTSINFEDELIEGSSQKPDLFYLFQKNNFKFKKLIRLRENFIPEMARNAEDVQRLRGGR